MVRIELVGGRTSDHTGDGEFQWLYLGKHAARLREWKRLGERNYLDVRYRFHALAEELRQPFLEFVARLGDEQPRGVAWECGSLARKDPDNSDLYLSLCHLRLVDDLIRRTPPDRTVLVLVEDVWLFEQCRITFATRREPLVIGRRRALWPSKLRRAARGAAARAAWTGRMIRELVSQRWHSAGARPSPTGADCLLYSLPHERCFGDERRWNDPFLGRLDTLLSGHGYSVARLAPIDGRGFAKQLARRSEYVYPMILHVSVRGLIAAIGVRGWTCPRSRPTVGGLDVSVLVCREWWTDLGRSGWCHYLLSFDCALRLMRTHRFGVVIFPYENQPWEKMLVRAARMAGVGSLGYQHSTVPRLLLNYFYARREADRLPFPDVVLTAGRLQARTLIDGGTPADKVAVGGSLRYEYLASGPANATVPQSRGDVARVLVVIAHDVFLAEALLDAIEREFPDRGASDQLAFCFRPHPTMDWTARTVGQWMTIVRGDLRLQLETFDVVVSTGTTVALEAVFLGIPVVKYQADVLLDTDPLDALPADAVWTVSRGGLRQAIMQAVERGRIPLSTELAAVRDSLFTPVVADQWVSAVSRLARDVREPLTTEVSR